VGAHILVDDNPTAPRDAEVVGVVGDVRITDLESAPPPAVYVLMQQIPDVNARWIANNMFWVIRAAQSTGRLETAARRVVQSVDGDVAASSIQPLETYLSTAMASRRFSLSLMAIFAAAALLLAASGLYALISHFVAQRQREIGVRMALGAQPRDIFLRVVGEGLLLTAAGVTIGLAGTFAVARLISTMLFGVTSYDPITIAEVAVLLTATAVAASYFPARRALSIDPVVALRDD
jgi:putative ABC transport system permease protein